MLQIPSHMVMASLLLCVQGKVGARAHNDGIVVKIWKSGCQPHFLCSTFGTTIPSKFYILFSTYIVIIFSHSSCHWALSFLLSHLSSLYSTYSTNVLNSLSKVARFITWLTTMLTTFCWDSVQQCRTWE